MARRKDPAGYVEARVWDVVMREVKKLNRLSHERAEPIDSNTVAALRDVTEILVKLQKETREQVREAKKASKDLSDDELKELAGVHREKLPRGKNR
jgi:hypothetical protein